MLEWSDLRKEGWGYVDDVVNGSVGGAPSEDVDVASSSFPLVKNQDLIEPVGL